ncbi:interleukin-11 [Triplophysa dalaica]|uniref:interleukin-11 n=1 Tax=Triplophysa dalaica TaxID=1582913 RepID=UPI0024DF73B9|nr:interleukin-11 [Triplophysa dalaica]
MKLFPDTTLPLIFFMSLVEFFGYTTSRPTSTSQGREGLKKLQHDMRRLSKLLTHGVNMSDMMRDFDRDLTSLPTLSYRAKDLKSLEVSSTLSDLYSGFKSFLFHLDWLQHEQEQQDTDFSKTKMISHYMKNISLKVLREIGTAPSEPIYPTLPPLNSYWNMYQATMEINKNLYLFCDWYTRALGVLNHRQ